MIFQRFEQNAARHPDKAAFIYWERGIWKTLAYADMRDATRRFASNLQALDVRAGMRVALMTPPSADFFPLALALLQLNLVPIILDPAIGLKKLGELLNQSQADMFIGNALTHGLRKIFGWGKATITINTSIGQLSKLKRPVQITNHQLPMTNTPAAIIFTSGSTGAPKGVIYTQANLSAQLDMLAASFNIAPDEIDLPAFPLYALIDLLLGVTSIIPNIKFPVPQRINPARICSAIQKFHVTNTFASPVVLDKLADYGIKHNVTLPSLKRVITAGAPAPTHLQIRFRKLLKDKTDLFGVYGATEVLPIAVIESREIFQDAQEKTARGAGICLGKPVHGAEVNIIQISDEKILEWQQAVLQPIGQVGEITVKGKSVTESYLALEEATQRAKIQDGDEVIHRMGDLGYLDERGRLWYCGRKSQRVTTHDDVLFTEQIEGIFNTHPLVYRSALVELNREPILYIELEKHARFVNKEKIKRELSALSTNHPQASKIREFRFLKKFPTDVRHNSKIIREELAGK